MSNTLRTAETAEELEASHDCLAVVSVSNMLNLIALAHERGHSYIGVSKREPETLLSDVLFNQREIERRLADLEREARARALNTEARIDRLERIVEEKNE